MRLDPALDLLHVVGALWASPAGPQACPSNLDAASRAAREAVWSLGPARPGAVTAFVGVNVVPMDTERVLANQTVLVEGGKITALGPADRVTVPAGALRIDGRGKYLMPGIGHGHDHETMFGLQGLIVRGDTVVASPEQRHALARNLAEGVTAILGGPPMQRFRTTIPSPYFYANTGVRDSVRRQGLDSMVAHLAAAKAAGNGHFVGGSGDDSLLVAAAARARLPISWHGHKNRFTSVLALGASGGNSDHLQFYEDSISLDRDGWRRIPPDVLREKMLSLASALRRAGVWVTPTLRCEIGFAGYWPASDPRVSHPVNVFYADFKLQFTKILHDAGVPLLLSADDNWSPHDDLTAFVRAGLTPYQALVAGTRNMAQFVGRSDSVGTVTVGKRADLVLLSGNPLQDVRHAREPVGVMVRGRWLDRATLDRGLLAPPKLWLQWVLRGRGDPGRFDRQRIDTEDQLGAGPGQGHRATLLALTDSLALVPPKGAEYERLARRFAAELGALRALLPPEQQREWLDPPARAWMREQARQGYQVTVPGVPPTP